ncbi:MAG: T9SS type A sorting domain-containing protein, partial [Bacteroidales bacterium]|nr:T9SS type A sorting domain-containing protein [Bacteroidales bacterium]
MSQGAFSQNINLTFTGSTTSGNYTQLDSVRVQNISRSWTETLVYPDTVLTFQQTGIADAQTSAAEITSYPNPFNGATNIAVTLTQSSDATVQIYNLAGQKIAGHSMPLEAGNNLFEVRLQNPQVYLLVVNTPHGRSTIKLLNRGVGSENSISLYRNSNIIEKRLSANPFQSGDVLKIIGYTTHNGETVASREVLQPQTASENFTLYFNFVNTTPTVITNTVSNITDTSAVCGGNVTSDGGAPITARGVCWSTISNPTINSSHTHDSSGTGIFTSNVTGLTTGTTYYIRAYATNSVGIAYGNEDTIMTWTIPTVTTDTASSITDTSAVCGGNVISDGGAPIIARGVCWSTTPNPTISNNHTVDSTGTGHFTSNITGLINGTTYYVRAYATNSVGTAYGNEDTIITNVSVVYTFSVSANTQVIFSPGNLQWSATDGGFTSTTHLTADSTAEGTWRFAPNQWDTIGAGNSNISPFCSGWIDLFGWGTSGWDN